nr:NAD(P)-dependent oxidoreductase [Actinomycetota bacterium]NIS30155.1 NAD(P)-dependent oxidoreductase [Actinomycetota bacterium]NIT94894.1 NAD(P)-dependent oxidoreductase [Actinomycetota bacterium]NIU18561.1 NAD(P)-dependent oxidoreductase [Actinomycetota bacterium]NIU65409.1 NAD(P)-dependent oxidoreductase [Actinomycetota bacterium]
MSEQTPDDVPGIDDWQRLLDGKVAVVTGGGDGIGGAV